MACSVNVIFCCATQPGYRLPKISSVGKDYELARRAKRVLAFAAVRLHLFNIAARRQLRFRAILHPRKKIPCIVKYNCCKKTRESSIGLGLLVVHYRIQNTINERSLTEISIAENTRQRNTGAVLSGT
jgi:hypothetical protein